MLLPVRAHMPMHACTACLHHTVHCPHTCPHHVCTHTCPFFPVCTQVSKWQTLEALADAQEFVNQRRPGRVSVQVQHAVQGMATMECADCRTKDYSEALEKKLARQVLLLFSKSKFARKMARQVLFPSFIFRANLLKELGTPFFERIAGIASLGYEKFSRSFVEEYRKKGSTCQERITNGSVGAEGVPGVRTISNAFFGWQDMDERRFRSAEARSTWQELYESEEFTVLLDLARRLAMLYLRNVGASVTQGEITQSNVHLWAAVHPQNESDTRHGWHVHPQATVSGVVYTDS